jgi:mannose-6-phosphate isomerase-like protein (cupin superfamily)
MPTLGRVRGTDTPYESKTSMKRTAVMLALPLVVGLAVGVIGGQSSMVLWPGDLSAQEVGQTKELEPGRVRKNLGESPSNIPGFEKVRIVEDTFQPGYVGKVSTMQYPMFCTILKGEYDVEVDGVKGKYKTGDSYVCQVGEKRQGSNTGSEPVVMRMHHLLKAGEK